MFNLFLSNAFDFSYIFKTVTTRWYYYVFAVAFFILLICLSFIKKQNKRNNLSKTQLIAYVAILTALTTVTNIFTIKITDGLQISFVATVGLLAGYMLGGGWGFAVCFLGDLIGAIIHPMGPYNPIIAIGTGLWGLVPGIAFSYFRGNQYLKTIISYVLCILIVSAGLNTWGICLMYPTRYTFSICLLDLPWKVLAGAVNCAISIGLICVLPRILPKDKFNLQEDKGEPQQEIEQTKTDVPNKA